MLGNNQWTIGVLTDTLGVILQIEDSTQQKYKNL